MKTWQDLTTQSEIHDKLSKPEVLAIIDILSENDSLSISEIHECFRKRYNSEITRRQIAYSLELMEENNIIENGDSENKEKIYSLIDVKEKIKVQITKPQVVFSIISAIVFIIDRSFFSIGFFLGVIIFVLLVHIEYVIFIRKNRNIYVNFANFNDKNHK